MHACALRCAGKAGDSARGMAPTGGQWGFLREPRAEVGDRHACRGRPGIAQVIGAAAFGVAISGQCQQRIKLPEHRLHPAVALLRCVPPGRAFALAQVGYGVQRALRANLRRHRARNGNQKLYWPGAEMLAVEEGAATIAKPVDDVYRGDGDTDRAIGLGVSRMKRK